jgi:ABC-type sugar transport system permease subunit
MSMKWLIIKIILLGLFNALAIPLGITLGRELGTMLTVGIILYVIAVNIVFIRKEFFPWRWVIPAMGGMLLLVVYPIGYSLVVAFTNYGSGHLLTKQQVIDQRLNETYVTEDTPVFKVYLYRNEAENAFNFWMVDANGRDFVYDRSDELIEVAPDDTSYGERDENGIPLALGNYSRLPAGGALRYSQSLQDLTIGEPPTQIRITRLGIAEAQDARLMQPRWEYDEETDTLTNLETGRVYHTERGNFVSGEGADRHVLVPGFPAYIGADNMLRVINDPNVRGPFWGVFIWTLTFAASSVILTLAVGLSFALLLNARDVPFRPIFRSILILPYAVPGWLLVTTWRGLLNPVYGPVNMTILDVFGVSPQWFSDPTLTKFAILFVNTYLGFPYMMLISMGVLQSISADMYEAAIIDGATRINQFRYITLPLLLIALAPLLVASFAFNFNNFTVIELFNNGGPPMGAATVAGHSDILLSYTYRLAFTGATGTDYGFAAAVSIFIFLIIAPITYFNFRLTRRFEELGQ